MNNEELASLKYQIKNDIIDALKDQLNEIKQEIHDLKHNYDIAIDSFPQIINDNISLALQDYQYFKNHTCFCFKRK